jgi:hypothetical protein
MNSSDIIDQTQNLLKTPKTKSPKIPAPLIANGKNRTGISYIDLTAKFMGIMADKGFKIGTHVDGTPDYNSIAVQVMFQLLVEAFKFDGAITVSIPPGIKITASGGNAGGPIQVVGQTIEYATGSAVIQ